jgi:very-short-patch-repair endonuclease
MIVEIDGDSHEDDTRSWKDEVRDAAFKELGIPTCRITTEEGLSRFRMTDEEILERITAVFNKA